MAIISSYVPSPIGPLLVAAADGGITGVWFANRVPADFQAGALPPGHGPGVSPPAAAHLERATTQLTEYFAGTRTAFDVTLDPHGTAFERQVWDLLREIPYGATTSYGALARRLGDVTLARAVGAANGANPIPVIVPCHRVIGAKGELTGFGGGIERKLWLLEHEGVLMKLGA